MENDVSDLCFFILKHGKIKRSCPLRQEILQTVIGGYYEDCYKGFVEGVWSREINVRRLHPEELHPV